MELDSLSFKFKEDIPICNTDEEIECSSNIEIDSKECLRQNGLNINKTQIPLLTFFYRSCSGLIISSFSKHVPDETFKRRMSKSIEQYKRYKKMLELPKKFMGKNMCT